MSDTVFIRELTAFATIGAYEWEQSLKQRLLFNIEMAWDFSQAAQTDDVRYCLNYAEVAETVLTFVESKPFKLVETVAYQLAELLQRQYQLCWLRIELHKPKAVAQAASVGVIVEKGKRSN